ncbi:MAG: hypothetical protein JWN46_369 [Acidimicrobiales bacterium]|nr:hypothetical protein [Acidimicrobiales bacterium]
MAKKGWTIPKVRRELYRSGRVLGDVQAGRTHTMGKRIARRAMGRPAGRLLGRLFR